MKLLDIIKNRFKKEKPQEKVQEQEEVKKKKLGLALGSGGARGFAHIGILKAFENEGIEFDIIAGTSAGSAVGAMYAGGYSANEILQCGEMLSLKDVKGGGLVFMPSSATYVENSVRKIMGDVLFSELKKPFACVAVDLITAKEVVFRSGSVAKAVSASCAVPPFYKPVVMDGMHLIDGAFTNPIPAKTVKDMGADIVIAIEVNPTRGVGTESLRMIDVMTASTRISTSANAQGGLAHADYVLKPDLGDYKAYSIQGANEMIRIGYETAYANMGAIKELLNLPYDSEKSQVKYLENLPKVTDK